MLRAMLPLILFIAVAASLTVNIGQYASILFGSIFVPTALLLSCISLVPR